MLERGLPYLCLEKFGQAKPLPERNSKTQKFRRYTAFDNTPVALSEGVTPAATQLEYTDVTITLQQYGDRTVITDVVQDTHEDPVLSEATEILGEQAAQLVENVRYNTLKAGSNVLYANGVARTAVYNPYTLSLQRKATRSLKRQNGRPITKVVRSTPSYGTENVRQSYIALVHPDMESTIRGLAGFKPCEDYGSMTPYENELGSVEDVRYLTSTLCEPWDDGGGAKGGGTITAISTSGTLADVYPVLIFGRDSYGIVALKGKTAVTPMVVNPKPSDSDPLGQRGHVAWKTMQGAVILNDNWMARVEVAVAEL
jgi:N4-gp56 family major capsid protein